MVMDDTTRILGIPPMVLPALTCPTPAISPNLIRCQTKGLKIIPPCLRFLRALLRAAFHPSVLSDSRSIRGTVSTEWRLLLLLAGVGDSAWLRLITHTTNRGRQYRHPQVHSKRLGHTDTLPIPRSGTIPHPRTCPATPTAVHSAPILESMFIESEPCQSHILRECLELSGFYCVLR